MSTDLKPSLATTVIALGLIVAAGLTAALHRFPLKGMRSPSHLFPVR